MMHEALDRMRAHMSEVLDAQVPFLPCPLLLVLYAVGTCCRCMLSLHAVGTLCDSPRVSCAVSPGAHARACIAGRL